MKISHIAALSTAALVAGLWAPQAMAASPPSAAAGAMLAEGLLISVRGLVREVTVFLLSGLWATWLWFGLTDEGYDWTTLPPIHVPDPVGRMMVMLIMLVYLTLYAVAESRPLRARA